MPRPARLFPCLCFVAIAFDWLDSLYQIIARRECEISKTVPKNRNEFCLPNVTHDRISVTSLFFTIFSSLRHTHKPFTHRFRLDVYTPCFSLFCFVFRFVFFFFSYSFAIYLFVICVTLFVFGTWQSQCVYKSQNRIEIAGRFRTNQLTVLHVKKKFTVSEYVFFPSFFVPRFSFIFSTPIRLENSIRTMCVCVCWLPNQLSRSCVFVFGVFGRWSLPHKMYTLRLSKFYIHHFVSARTGNHLASQVASSPKENE